MLIKPESLRQKFDEARRQGRPKDRPLTDEQEFFLVFVDFLYKKLDLPLETFASQVGVKSQTVRLWLRKAGNLPGQRAQERILELYARNSS